MGVPKKFQGYTDEKGGPRYFEKLYFARELIIQNAIQLTDEFAHYYNGIFILDYYRVSE